MKMILISMTLMILLVGSAIGQDKTPATKMKQGNTQVVKHCPVTGETADPEVTYAYNGVTYSFCCSHCVAKFKKDPEKYIKASTAGKHDACDHTEEAGVKKTADKEYTVSDGTAKATINKGKDLSAQITNRMCPVMKKAVDKEVTTVTYKNKVYGFCCSSCIKKFAANPDKYLKN